MDRYKVRRILQYSSAILLGLLVIFFVVCFIIYPAEYVITVFSMGPADVGDMNRFDSAPISKSNQPYNFSYDLDDTWIEGLFEKQVDIDDLNDYLEKRDTSAFIVIINDSIRYEKYFADYQRDSLVTSFSVAKSFVSSLIGIAIDKGQINAVTDPITEFLPELIDRDDRFSSITIENLLMMSSGIKYKETGFINGDDSKTYYWPDLRDLAINYTEIEGNPNEVFHYNNYHPLLLGLILERATGQSVSSFLHNTLWSRIGTEFDASWSVDASGYEKMESGLNARAIDFAKFARLYLNLGLWEGEQILSSSWVSTSTSPLVHENYEEYYSEYEDYIFDDTTGFYSYMWWGKGDDYLAMGNLGQFIYISPLNDLIILRFGESYGSLGGSLPWIKMFHEFANLL
ncbi:MAG: serine hydrolase [Candidatus Heimdallarchaeota archaeon]|nr:serine hydrolase [Candidatus Heimdallarchaeota archaeon]